MPFSSSRNKKIRVSIARIDEMKGEDKTAVFMPTPKRKFEAKVSG